MGQRAKRAEVVSNQILFSIFTNENFLPSSFDIWPTFLLLSWQCFLSVKKFLKAEKMIILRVQNEENSNDFTQTPKKESLDLSLSCSPPLLWRESSHINCDKVTRRSHLMSRVSDKIPSLEKWISESFLLLKIDCSEIKHDGCNLQDIFRLVNSRVMIFATVIIRHYENISAKGWLKKRNVLRFICFL